MEFQERMWRGSLLEFVFQKFMKLQGFGLDYWFAGWKIRVYILDFLIEELKGVVLGDVYGRVLF